MTEIISNLKKHTCPTCGGQLIVNEARRMYECPFCGVTFDYEYFREDDVLDRADRALRAGELKSAQEAYEFMLTKEPSNFVALRGMILIAAGAKNTYEFARADSLKKMNTPLVDERIQHAIDHCLPEHSAYFSKMKELFDTTDSYEEGLLKNRDLHVDRKKEYSMLQRVSDRKNELFFEVNSWEDPEVKVQVRPKSVAYMLIAFYVFFCLIIVMIFAAMHNNPYSKTATTTTKSKPTYSVSYIGSGVALTATESQLRKQYEQQGMDPTEASKQAKQKVKMFSYSYSSVNSKSILDISNDKKKAEEEETRKQKEKDWEKNHANDGLKEALWILIPGVLVTLICVYLFRREKKIESFDGEMLTPYRERASEITDEILKNEDSTNHLKNQIHQLYKEMKALDPMPEKVSAPETVKMHKKQRKRWE